MSALNEALIAARVIGREYLHGAYASLQAARGRFAMSTTKPLRLTTYQRSLMSSCPSYTTKYQSQRSRLMTAARKLESMGLIEVRENGGVRLFRLTAEGRRVRDSFETRGAA